MVQGLAILLPSCAGTFAGAVMATVIARRGAPYDRAKSQEEQNTESGTKKRSKGLLIGAAAGALSVPLFVILHNLFFEFSAKAKNVVLLSRFLESLGATCFILALFACPVAAIVCLVWALIERLAQRSTVTRSNLLNAVSPLAAVAAFVFFVYFVFLSGDGEEVDRAAGYNGSFELVKSGSPVNWHVYRGLNGSDGEMTFDTADKVDGTQSVKFVVRKANPVGGNGSPGLFQVSYAQEGRPYRISFWLKTQGAVMRLNITSDAPGHLWVTRTPAPIIELINAENMGGESWHQFIYKYTVPAHYSNIRFEINVVAPGTAWLDNVRFDPL